MILFQRRHVKMADNQLENQLAGSKTSEDGSGDALFEQHCELELLKQWGNECTSEDISIQSEVSSSLEISDDRSSMRIQEHRENEYISGNTSIQSQASSSSSDHSDSVEVQKFERELRTIDPNYVSDSLTMLAISEDDELNYSKQQAYVTHEPFIKVSNLSECEESNLHVCSNTVPKAMFSDSTKWTAEKQESYSHWSDEDNENNSESFISDHNCMEQIYEFNLPDGCHFDLNRSSSSLYSQPIDEKHPNPSLASRPKSDLSSCRGASMNEIKHYASPRPAFQKTIAFSKILNYVMTGCKVVHIHGMSGSGKSQIVRGVCKELDSGMMPWIIWHIQCQDGSEIIKGELQRFIVELESLELLYFKERGKMLEELCSGDTNTLVEKISHFNQNVLLVFEDVPGDPKSERFLAQNLIQNLGKGETSTSLQILIASQKEDSIFTQGDINAMRYYTTERISGFTKSEAVSFLECSARMYMKMEKVEELAEALAYSPLRLTLAKNYCIKYRESYKSYLESLGKDKEIIEKEKELLQLHPEIARCHGYEVIKRAVHPAQATEEENLQFSIIKMISCLNNEGIPDLLLGRFFQEKQPLDVKKEQRMVQYLLVKLKTDCDASIHSISETGAEYGETLTSIHNDILLAVDLEMGDDEKQNILIQVLQAMAALIKKENRFRFDNSLLFNLVKHMNSIVFHASKSLTDKFERKNANINRFEIQLGLSRIYEVLGFVNTRHRRNNDDCLEKALNYIWCLVCSYSKGTVSLKSFTKVKHKSMLLTYEQGKDPVKIAQKVYRVLKEANKNIPDKFVVTNWARSFPVTEYSIRNMRDKLGDNCGINWVEILSTAQQNRRLNEGQIRVLQKRKMLLHTKQLKGVYLCERIASILHTRGRQLLYLQNNIPVEEQQRYEWYTEVGISLCKAMFQDTGIHSVFEYILEANNKLPRMLSNRLNEDDNTFIGRIKNAKNYAQEIRNVKGEFYEHGIYKTIAGTEYTIMNALRYYVKANTKMHKQPNIVPTHSVSNELDECDRFFDLAKNKVCDFVVASNCMIQAGKYYAAVGKYDKALDAFEAGFNHNGRGIEHQSHKYPDAYAWALNNIGWTLCKAGAEIKNVQSHKLKFLLRYEKVLKLDITREWRTTLNGMRERVGKIECPPTVEEITSLWPKKIKTIFCDVFVDQLEAESNGDICQQIRRSYEHLQNEGAGTSFLRDEFEISEWKNVLGLQHTDLDGVNDRISDPKTQKHQLALLFVERACHVINSAGAEDFGNPGSGCELGSEH